MSKMPSKKKSCFQITSVTQAQVAGNCVTDDAESLEDPDESRTEDMCSSEVYDVSKAGDFEPEVCDACLSDETEAEGAGARDGAVTQVANSQNAGVQMNPTVRGAAGHISPAPGSPQTSPVVSSGTPSSVSSSATVSTCSSRFRVIKLDHGTGEPFKRGRWTCTEFYERDTDVSTSGRTVDGVKHAEHGTDRDAPGASAPAFSAEPHTDSGYVSSPSNPPAAELQKQAFGVLQQGLGLVAQNLFADAQHVKSPTTQPFYPGKPAQTVVPNNPADYRLAPGTPAAPLMPPAAGSAHMFGLVPQPVDGRGLPISQPELVQGLSHQSGASGTVPASAVGAQAPVPLAQPAVTVSVSAHAVQNVPVVLPSASNTPQSVPKQPPVPVVPPQPQGSIPSGSAAGLGAQIPPTLFSQLPIGFSQADESQRKCDMLLQSSVLLANDPINPLHPEGLQLHTPAVRSLFGIAIPIDGDEDRNPSTAFYQAFPNGRSKVISDGASGASVVAIDNKIEQAMDLVKSHLMYAVREEVEVLKEQIKELYERNSVLERENAVLKSLANTEQLTQLTSQISIPGSTSPQQTPANAILQEGSELVALPPQPNVSTA